jgi:hypothetical protein
MSLAQYNFRFPKDSQSLSNPKETERIKNKVPYLTLAFKYFFVSLTGVFMNGGTYVLKHVRPLLHFS